MPPLFMYPRPSKFSTSLLVASPPAGLVGRHQHGLAGRGDLAPDIDDGRGFADPPDVHRDRWCVHLVPPFTLWLRWAGQRSAAMRQYRTLVRVLDRDLAVRPLSETTQLYDEVRAGRLEPPPSRAGGEPDHSGPPAPVTWPLVGREVELAALRSAWQAAGGTGGWWRSPARPAAARPGLSPNSASRWPRPVPQCWRPAVTTARLRFRSYWPPTCCGPRSRSAPTCRTCSRRRRPPWRDAWSRRWPRPSPTRPRRPSTARSPSPGCTAPSPTPCSPRRAASTLVPAVMQAGPLDGAADGSAWSW